MGEEKQVPLLLEFLFGEAAETAQRGASARLMLWAEAFEGWLAERAEIYKPGTVKYSKLTWRRLLGERGQMPWQLTQADMEAHVAWMGAQEYAPGTINSALGILGSFYRWCDERGVDPGCEPGFNPAAGVKRARVKPFERAQLLSRAEVEALLGILEADETPLGKRDYAFFLFRLRVGVRLHALRRLQWGQIERDEGGQWVRWRPGAEPWPLPGEVWGAILAYLEASGRLAGMHEEPLKGELQDEAQKRELLDEAYIFAPLAQPGVVGAKDTAQEWAEGRPQVGMPILDTLKLYGGLVGIPEGRLTLRALRNTALRLRLDQGASLEQMRAFMDSQQKTRLDINGLKKLPELPGDAGWQAIDARPPDRTAKPFKPGYGLRHGFRARRMPEEEVQAVLAEDIHGVQEEIAGMQRLLRDLDARRNENLSLKEEMQLLDTLTQSVSRLTQLQEAGEQLQQGVEPDSGLEDILEMFELMGVDKGEPGRGEEVRAELYGSESGDDLRAKQVASIRCSLRRTLKMALEAEKILEFLRLMEFYGRGSVRLMRMLKRQASDHNRAHSRFKEAIGRGVLDLNREYGRIP